MKKIPLTQGKFALVDDEDYELVSKFKWCAWKSHGNIFYAQRNSKTKNGWRPLLMHTFLMKEKGIDHINNIGTDNRRENLRLCNQSQNTANARKHKNCSSKFKGVCWHKCANKWFAQIHEKGTEIYLGLFEKEIDAAKAYNKKALELFGEFARLNIIKKEK
jgi:hypothetical protein